MSDRCPFCGEPITGQPLEHLVDCGPSLEWLGDPPASPTDCGPPSEERSSVMRGEMWKRGFGEWTLCGDTGHAAQGGSCPVHEGDACLRQYLDVRAFTEVAGEVARLQERVGGLEGALCEIADLNYHDHQRCVAGTLARAALSTTEGETND